MTEISKTDKITKFTLAPSQIKSALTSSLPIKNTNTNTKITQMNFEKSNVPHLLASNTSKTAL